MFLPFKLNKRLFRVFFVLLIFIINTHALPTINIPVKITTASTENDVDDCAIWVHPSDPSKSLVIINDKGPSTDKGGLYVYNLNGVLIQKTFLHCPQNPDIRYNVAFGSDTMDVLVCVDREANDTNYNKIRVFKINPLKAEAASGFLTEITTKTGITSGQKETYGHSLYLRPSDGSLFSVVCATGKADFTQVQLTSDGSGNVKGTLVRTWGRKDISGDMCEGICCDDELGFIYICDENARVLKYFADPDRKSDSLIAVLAQDDGIEADREGINIYRCSQNTGYIVLSSQGNNQIKIYDRITNAFMGTVVPEKMKDCDGLDVTAVPLGKQFPHGMAAFHLGSTAGAQFGFYDWSDIATGLNLATPCDAQRPSSKTYVLHPVIDPVHIRPLNHTVRFLSLDENTVSWNFCITNPNRRTTYSLQGKQIGKSNYITVQNKGVNAPSECRSSGVYLTKFIK